MAAGSSKLGFTLVELTVAILVLSVGLLALVATSAVATRMLAEGRRASRVAALASQRMAMLSCSAVDGAAADGPYMVTWTVSGVEGGAGAGAGAGAARVRVAVGWPIPSGVRADSFSTLIPC